MKRRKEKSDYFEIYQNYKWLMETDVSKYDGEWICISHQKVVAHNKKIKEVMKYIEDHMLVNFTLHKVDNRLKI